MLNHKLDACTRVGIDAVRFGDAECGRKLLRQALIENPRNEVAWLWMALIVDDPEQQRDCLQRVLEINPQNQAAYTRLAALSSATYQQVAKTAADPSAPAAYSPCADTEALSGGAWLSVDGEIDEDMFGSLFPAGGPPAPSPDGGLLWRGFFLAVMLAIVCVLVLRLVVDLL